MSAGLTIEAPELKRLQQKLLALSTIKFDNLLESIGGIIESQTRRRIGQEKTSPDGAAWKPWSPEYAATRHANHSLLIDTGAMLDSIMEAVHHDELEVGTNVVYAREQNAARQFLGLSSSNEHDIVAAIDKFFDEQFKGGHK